MSSSLDMNALLTATEAAAYAGVSVSAVVNWRRRGHLPVAVDAEGSPITDSHNRPRYRLLDVAKAEYATKQRGDQMARKVAQRNLSAMAA